MSTYINKQKQYIHNRVNIAISTYSFSTKKNTKLISLYISRTRRTSNQPLYIRVSISFPNLKESFFIEQLLMQEYSSLLNPPFPFLTECSSWVILPYWSPGTELHSHQPYGSFSLKTQRRADEHRTVF